VRGRNWKLGPPEYGLLRLYCYLRHQDKYYTVTGLCTNNLPKACMGLGSGAHPASYPPLTACFFHGEGLRRPGSVAVHSLPSSAQDSHVWICTSTLCTFSWRCALLSTGITLPYQMESLDGIPFDIRMFLRALIEETL
jgi:hypothetical protein